jgi:hypothetical protein
MADLYEKLKIPLRELGKNCSRELRLARWSHWLNISAMIATLVTTGVAVIYGLIPHHRKLRPHLRCFPEASPCWQLR